MLLGDTSQHESVGRGSVLRGLAEEHGALDLLKTGRANEEWLREVPIDLRAGVVSRARVRSWAEATRFGKSALLVASRNDDVRAMNELAREAVRERIGEERVYATDFGERSFGIGDVLVVRERAHGGVHGDLYALAGHRDDGRLELGLLCHLVSQTYCYPPPALPTRSSRNTCDHLNAHVRTAAGSSLRFKNGMAASREGAH